MNRWGTPLPFSFMDGDLGNMRTNPRMTNIFSSKTYINGLVVVSRALWLRFKAVSGLNGKVVSTNECLS